jgi:hypothetical protein
MPFSRTQDSRRCKRYVVLVSVCLLFSSFSPLALSVFPSPLFPPPVFSCPLPHYFLFVFFLLPFITHLLHLLPLFSLLHILLFLNVLFLSLLLLPYFHPLLRLCLSIPLRNNKKTHSEFPVNMMHFSTPV